VTLSYQSRTPDQPWQARVRERSQNWIAGAILMDPGMGKTKVVLDTAGAAYVAGAIDTLVAIAPNGVHEVWAEEAAKHLGIPHVAAVYRSGTVNNPVRAALRVRDRLVVIALNVELLSTAAGLARCREVMAGRRVLLVLDESQKIRTPGTARTRNAWRLGEAAVMRRITTGTVVTRGFENLYAQYRFLHPLIIGCKTYTEFKARYCVLRGPFNEIVGYQNVEDLLARIGRRTAFAYESEMGLAEPIVRTRYTALSAEQARLYRSLKETFLAELRSGAVIEAPLMITRLQKFQQLVAGHLRDTEGEWHPVPTPRIADTVDVVANAPSKTIVWAQWQPDIVQLSVAFTKAGIPHVTYYGGNTTAVNRENLARFKTDPAVHCFLSTQSSGGAGLTINEAKHTVNFSHTFNTEHTWQARKRNHRLGQESVIQVTNLVARGTIDVTLLASERKKADFAALLRSPDLVARWLDGD